MYNIAAGRAIATARAGAPGQAAKGQEIRVVRVAALGPRAQEPTGSLKCSRKVLMPSTRGPSSKGRRPGCSMRRS